MDKTCCFVLQYNTRTWCYNSDVVPLGSRMDGLEKTVATLVKSIEDLKTSHAKEVPTVVVEPPQPTFATVAATGTMNDNNVNANSGATQPRSNSQTRERVQRQRIHSNKRKNEEEVEKEEEKEKEFEYPKRRQRKVNYGKSNVNVAGGEAAPYDVYIGNTNPASTEEIIKKVLEKCLDTIPADQKPLEPFEILSISCMTKARDDGYPLRTKSWKVTVPNRLREYMMKDEAYPCGWSHRRFFPKRNNNAVPDVNPSAKKVHLDPSASGAGSPTSA